MLVSPCNGLVFLVLCCGCLALLQNPRWLPITYRNGSQFSQPVALAFRNLVLSARSLPLSLSPSPSLPPDCLCPPAETLHPSLSICLSGSLLPPQKFSSSVPREGMSRHTPPLKLVQILALLLISFGTTVELSNLSAPISHLGNRDNNNTYSIRWLRQLNN